MDIERIINRVVARFIGTKHERDIKRIAPTLVAINALEPEMKALADADFPARTAALKTEIAKRLESADPTAKDYKDQLLSLIHI